LRKAWANNEPVRPVHPETIADGIAVGAPGSAAMVLRDVRESEGGFVAVSDEAILGAIRTLAAKGGIITEPAGETAFAGLEPALKAGLIDRENTTAVHVTGTGFKNPRYLQTERKPAHIPRLASKKLSGH
jgi:threonine synthase